ncbi:sulfurtransferase [Nonomuraea sp. NPDC047897]|uniref:sulfurtransferase n=1 Tax=Nonomuraea sp. NPDC047897 TaxID=3364346 RepID=UPI00371E20D2
MSPLITPAGLAALDGASVLDVRWRLGGPAGADLYREGHLPGAVFCDVDADLAATPGRAGRHPLPSAEHFQRAMRRLGVHDGRPVVVYDDAGSTTAARAWWTLRYFGHPDVRVLDGGLPAWTEAGLPTDKEPVEVAPGDFTARPGGMPMLTAEQAAALAGDGVLLDARAAERYRGEVEPVDPVAGHIPGAVSAPTTGNVGPDGRFLPPDALRARFAELGVRDGVAAGAYCGSGVTAAHQVLALELAGLPAALYVGSWSHWVADPSRPVATG